MKTVPLSEAKAKLSRLVAEVRSRDEEITITRNGRAAAILMSPDQFEGWKETITIRSDGRFIKEIRRGIAQLRRTKKTYTLEELFGDEA